FQTVRRHTTLRPRLQPGKDILALTRALMKLRNADQAIMWLQAYNEWEQRWDSFLRHRTYPTTHVARPTGVSDTTRMSSAVFPGSTPPSSCASSAGRYTAAQHSARSGALLVSLDPLYVNVAGRARLVTYRGTFTYTKSKQDL
ncbi:MAG: hypothetical protein ACK5MR_01400, partial [Cumulibacter sp.]